MSEETIVLEVIGENELCCSMCERTIRRTMKRSPGVRRVDPSHKTQRIELTLDTERITLEAAQEKIEQAGGWQTRELSGSAD